MLWLILWGGLFVFSALIVLNAVLSLLSGRGTYGLLEYRSERDRSGY